MNDYILEVCVDSAESALAAAKGGASRLELCQNLVIGGTTPSPKLFEVIRRQTTIPIHEMCIRDRRKGCLELCIAGSLVWNVLYVSHSALRWRF